MMKHKDIHRKVLNYLHGEYLKRHGPGSAHLGDFRISMVDSGMARVVSELSGNDPELEEAVFEELSSRGLVALCGNGPDISLTAKGVSEASKTALDRFMEFLNSNPGLAILVPLASLTLAAIALFIHIN